MKIEDIRHIFTEEEEICSELKMTVGYELGERYEAQEQVLKRVCIRVMKKLYELNEQEKNKKERKPRTSRVIATEGEEENEN